LAEKRLLRVVDGDECAGDEKQGGLDSFELDRGVVVLGGLA
jgi:hypothetical protein